MRCLSTQLGYTYHGSNEEKKKDTSQMRLLMFQISSLGNSKCTLCLQNIEKREYIKCLKTTEKDVTLCKTQISNLLAKS
jgi:hypothetical protein